MLEWLVWEAHDDLIKPLRDQIPVKTKSFGKSSVIFIQRFSLQIFYSLNSVLKIALYISNTSPLDNPLFLSLVPGPHEVKTCL